jgi:hypothetical protein
LGDGAVRKEKELTPELEAKIKDQIWERMRQRLSDEYVAEYADLLEHQWAWCLELGIIDEETDLSIER